MKIVIIKIGSGTLLTNRNKFDEFRIAHIANQILTLRKIGVGVVLIVSGAVASGSNYINLLSEDIKTKKIAAGIGQALLISIFQKLFFAKHLIISQILLTKDLFSSEEYKNSIRETLEFYCQNGVIPIINENDVIDINSFGGNDFLASIIANLLKVEQLIILSQMERSIYGVGGGEEKRQVVKNLNEQGIMASIINGKEENVIINNIL